MKGIVELRCAHNQFVQAQSLTQQLQSTLILFQKIELLESKIKKLESNVNELEVFFLFEEINQLVGSERYQELGNVNENVIEKLREYVKVLSMRCLKKWTGLIENRSVLPVSQLLSRSPKIFSEYLKKERDDIGNFYFFNFIFVFY